MSEIIVSAPGKVLLTGGYLVLDSKYDGLVIATDSRFFTSIKSAKSIKAIPGALPRISVRSPQFEDGLWVFSVDLASPTSVALHPISDVSNTNKFVEIALKTTLSISRTMVSKSFPQRLETGLEITIQGHNDFYSQRNQLARLGLPLNSSSLKSLPKFCPTLTTLKDVNKTGLGSSAAMMTSLVAAVLEFFGVVALKEQRGLDLVHSVAQYVHCFAQGKIGSGFDVSAAVYGSHVYRRFDPLSLEPLMTPDVSTDSLIEHLSTPLNSTVTPFTLPKDISLLMAEINCGSNTPKMVSSVLKWRKAHPEDAEKVYMGLNSSNTLFVELLNVLRRMELEDPQGYERELNNCLSTPLMTRKTSAGTSTPIAGCRYVSETFRSVRAALVDLGTHADVPIEPSKQTQLLDLCMNIPGVLAAGVPGAGGFDAIFCLVVKGAEPAVEAAWAMWTETSVAPLLARESIGVGVQLEDVFPA